MALPFRFNSQKKPFQQEPSHDSLAQQFVKTGQSVAKVIRFWQPWSLCNEKLFYEQLWKQKNGQTLSMLASFENAESFSVVQPT